MDQPIAERSIFCPSCAARVADSAADPTTGLLRCPVCGTQFNPEAAANESAESAIVKSDAPGIASNTRRLSTEQILLERLSQEAPAKPSISWRSIALIILGILAVSYGIYKASSKPDQYAKTSGVDSTTLFQHRVAMQHIIDSVQGYVSSHPDDMKAHLTLADAYYDGAYWSKSIQEFEKYLKHNPSDAAARVDYAYALAQQPAALPQALSQIDTALSYKPDYIPALYNGGVLSLQLQTGDHAEVLARAKSYFERAKAIADTSAPFMAKQIDTLLVEIDRTGARAASRAPTGAASNPSSGTDVGGGMGGTENSGAPAQ